MKVLMVNRPKNLWIGGDYIQMERTAEELAKLGVDVEISEQPLIRPAIRMREFDVVHSFNFPMIWSKYSIWSGAKWGKKNVCSMLYHDLDQFVSYGEQQLMADSLDNAIFIAQGEYERFKKNIKIDEKKVSFISNGIDDFWFNDTGLKTGNFILTVGRLDGTKGQLELAIACKKMGLELVCVGERNNEAYADSCEKLGAKLVGTKTPGELVKLYAKCKAFALCSKAEVMPLTIMEAGAQSKPVILSDKCEYKFKNVIWTDNSIDSISDCLSKASKMPSNKPLMDEVSNMTWKIVAEKIKAIYETS